MSIKKAPYEISLWQDQLANFRRVITGKEDLVVNQAIYLKRGNGSFYNCYYRGFNPSENLAKHYEYQLGDNQEPQNFNLVTDGDIKLTSSNYPIGGKYSSSDISVSHKYTVVLNGTATSGQSLAVYTNTTHGPLGISEVCDGTVKTYIIKGTSSAIITDLKRFSFYNYPQKVGTTATINWVCIYDGWIDNPPLDFIPNPTQRKTFYANENEIYIDKGIIDEEKIAILGSSSATFEGSATGARFLKNINGTNQLTFSLPRNYFDYYSGEKKKNPLTNEIFEESKIKLKFDGEWYDLVVKAINEAKTKTGIVYTYTCSDNFIDELSKQGWTLIFDEENGLGSINELSEIVLKDSEWTYIPSSDFIETEVKYKEDENGNIIFDPNTNLPIEEEVTVPLPRTKYEKILKRYVTEYSATGVIGEIWGYDTTETITTETTRNLLTNSDNFLDTVGWVPGTNATVYPKLFKFDASEDDEYRLIVKKTVSSGSLPLFSNDTLKSSRYSIKPGMTYAFRIKMSQSQIKMSLRKDMLDPDTSLFGDVTVNNNTYTVIRSGKALTQVILTLQLVANAEYQISSLEFFEVKAKDGTEEQKKLIDGWAHGSGISQSIFEDNCLIPKTATPPQVYKEPITYYYQYDSKGEPDHIDLTGKNPQKIMRDNSQKIRILKAEKSNRFNLLQDVAELFEGWARFSVRHDNLTGKIYRDPVTGKQEKTVAFVKEIGQINGAGFHYGQNLVDIQRDRNADELVTKMFVEKNDTDLAENGVVTIEQADSDLNISGENFLLDFGYFTRMGMINAFDLINDLYGTTISDLGYLKNLGKINKEIDGYTGTNVGLNDTIATLKVQKEGLELQISAQKQRISDLQAELEKPNTDTMKEEKNEAIASYRASIKSLEANLATVTSQLTSYNSQQEDLNKKIEALIEQKKDLNEIFNNKYARFIKEGVWQDSNYLTPNEYYLDAQKVLIRSSRPQVSYSMNVIDLRALPEYSDWVFNIGDKTFVTDDEFFGKDSTGRLNMEEVTLTEIEYDLENPKNNKITVQNFKTQFEDLFSRIAAASQTIQFKDGLFSKTANNFTADGQIKVDILQSTLANNSLILAGSKDQSVTISDAGIQLGDLFNASKVMRLVSSGIFLSKDGGTAWTTGITADGINASVLNAGQINVQKVQIMTGEFPTFLWNDEGLTAYRVYTSSGNIFASETDFVRLDQHGLYMTLKSSAFKPEKTDTGYQPWFHKINSWEDRTKYIEDNSLVSLTWNGLLIKSETGAVRISTHENNIKITDTSDLNSEKLRVILGNTGSQSYKYYNPKFKFVNTGTEASPVWVEGKEAGTFTTIAEFDTKIALGYDIGYYFIYTGTPQIIFNGVTVDKGDALITKLKRAAGAQNKADFSVSKNILSGITSNYGLTIKNNDGFTVFKTDSTGILWLQNSMYIGEVDTEEAYFGIEISRGDRNNKVLWISPDSGVKDKYVFSVDGNGKLVANEAYISGTIYATDGKFTGEIEATSGTFRGDVFAKTGNIENAIYIGATFDDSGSILGYKSGIASRKLNSQGGLQHPYALWINYPLTEEDRTNGLRSVLIGHDGSFFAENVNITGSITAQSGSIEGKLSLGGENFLLDGSKPELDENENEISVSRILVKNSLGDGVFSVDQYGKVIAKNILIGNAASIEEYLIVGDSSAIIDMNKSNYVIASGSFDINDLRTLLNKIHDETDSNLLAQYNAQLVAGSNFLLANNGNITIRGKDNNIFGNLTINTTYTPVGSEGDYESTGKLTVGDIVIDKDRTGMGRIYVKNEFGNPAAWEIKDNGDARFENAYINGTLEVTRFKYDEIQVSSGTIVVRPSCELRKIDLIDFSKPENNNVLLKSDVPYSNSNYPTMIYTINGGANTMKAGDIFTIVVKGNFKEGSTSWGIYNSGGNVTLISLSDLNKVGDVYIGQGTWKIVNGPNTANNLTVHFYSMPNQVDKKASIEWVKLVKGPMQNVSLEWLPCPADIGLTSSDKIYKLLLTQNLPSYVSDYICVQGKTEFTNNRLYGFIHYVANDKLSIFVNDFYLQDLNSGNNNERPSLPKDTFNPYRYSNGTFLNMGQQNNTGIVINAMDKSVFGQKESISFYKNRKVVNSSGNWFYQREGNLILGNLDGITEIQDYLPEDDSPAGKNLFNQAVLLSGFIDANTGEIINSTSFPNSVYCKTPILLKKGEAVVYSSTLYTIDFRYRLFNLKGIYIGSISLDSTHRTYTATEDCYAYVLLYQGVDNSSTTTNKNTTDLQIEYGIKSTSYENFIAVGLASYGLYTDNAILKGTIIATNPRTRMTAGITTKDDNNVVFWAGAQDYNNKTSSTFYVTEEGYVHAEKGYFRGTIETVDAIISGRIINNGLKVDGLSKGIIFITGNPDRDLTKTPIAAGNVTGVIDSEGLDLYTNSNFRIFNNVSYLDDKDRADALSGKSPYIFSEDSVMSFTSNNFDTFEYQAFVSGTSLKNKGLKIKQGKIQYIEKTTETADYSNQFKGWFSQEANASILFEDGKIIFVRNENVYETEKSAASPKFMTVSQGIISAVQLNIDIANIKKTLKLAESVSFIPFYANSVQDGFDIYLE